MKQPKPTKNLFQYWLDDEQNNNKPEFFQLRALYPKDKRRFGAWLRYKQPAVFNKLYNRHFAKAGPERWDFVPVTDRPLARDTQAKRAMAKNPPAV